MPGAPRANTSADSISGYEGRRVCFNALGKGYQLGFEASSDHISTHISFTNIWVTTPTRAGILDAMKKQDVAAPPTTHRRGLSQWGHFMGEAFTATSAPVFTVRLWGTALFQSVVIVKDNNIVYFDYGDRAVAFTWQDQTAVKGKTSYYYVRGVQTDGQIVWVSPMRVTLQ
jgi:hypothetical protein